MSPCNMLSLDKMALPYFPPRKLQEKAKCLTIRKALLLFVGISVCAMVGWLHSKLNNPPDLALLSSDAIIIKTLTSPPLELSDLPWRMRLNLQFWGGDKNAPEYCPSSMVFQDEGKTPSCWRFSGPQGHLGIKFVQPGRPTRIVIRQPLYDQENHPRSLVVWGSPSAVEYEQSRYAKAGKYLSAAEVQMVLHTFTFVKLAHLRDVSNDNHDNQTFMLRANGTTAFDMLLIEFTQNWGGKSTCVHHIGVYGEGA
ncbi:hypothetical protein BDZ89DRAFT_1151572 [Hymenopellis radicata]|nr:hypothetical protein BDZ89DRAFT_1151572 [Hymenopellis radicata]